VQPQSLFERIDPRVSPPAHVKLVHDNLEEFQDPANYDLEVLPVSGERIAFHCEVAARVGGPVLELACGSGIVTLPIARQGLDTTGVDLAAPMLAHAERKARQQGLAVRWVHDDAQTVDLRRQFALVVLTGNAFQAFLGDADQAELLENVARHLKPDGWFVFETRNPQGHDLVDSRDEEAWFDYTNTAGRRVTVSGVQTYEATTQVLHWTTFRRWHDGHAPRTSTTRVACRFTQFDDLDRRLADQGLVAIERYGDWIRTPFDPGRSGSIVSLCRRAR